MFALHERRTRMHRMRSVDSSASDASSSPPPLLMDLSESAHNQNAHYHHHAHHNHAHYHHHPHHFHHRSHHHHHNDSANNPFFSAKTLPSFQSLFENRTSSSSSSSIDSSFSTESIDSLANSDDLASLDRSRSSSSSSASSSESQIANPATNDLIDFFRQFFPNLFVRDNHNHNKSVVDLAEENGESSESHEDLDEDRLLLSLPSPSPSPSASLHNLSTNSLVTETINNQISDTSSSSSSRSKFSPNFETMASVPLNDSHRISLQTLANDFGQNRRIKSSENRLATTTPSTVANFRSPSSNPDGSSPSSTPFLSSSSSSSLSSIAVDDGGDVLTITTPRQHQKNITSTLFSIEQLPTLPSDINTNFNNSTTSTISTSTTTTTAIFDRDDGHFILPPTTTSSSDSPFLIRSTSGNNNTITTSVTTCVYSSPEDYELITAMLCASLLVLAIVYLAYGYRCFRAIAFCTGFAFGAALAYAVCTVEHFLLDLSPYGPIGAALTAGLAVGLLTALVTYIGLFVVGLHLGMLIGVAMLTVIYLLRPHFDILQPPLSPLTLLILFVAVGLVGAFSTVYFAKGCTIIGSSMYGAALLLLCVDYFVENFRIIHWFLDCLSNGDDWYGLLEPAETRRAHGNFASSSSSSSSSSLCIVSQYILSLWPALTLTGIVIQCACTGRRISSPFGRHDYGVVQSTPSTMVLRSGHTDITSTSIGGSGSHRSVDSFSGASAAAMRGKSQEDLRLEQKHRKYRYLYQVRTAHGDVISQHYFQSMQNNKKLCLPDHDSFTFNSDLSSHFLPESRTTTLSVA